VKESINEHGKSAKGTQVQPKRTDSRSAMPPESENAPKQHKVATENTRIAPEQWENIKEGNPLVQKHSVTRYYRCLEHPEYTLPNGGTAHMHFSRTHGLNLDGTNYTKETKGDENKPKDNEENKENPRLVDPLKKEIEEELQKRGYGPQGEKPPEVFVPETIVTEYLNKDIADGATKVAKNLELQYLYYKTKSIFPPDWSFETFILYHVSQSLEQWGIRALVYQDLEGLSDEQLIAMKKARDVWSKQSN